MAPKLWSKLFSKQTPNQSKLTANNTSINDSEDSLKNDLIFNKSIDEKVLQIVSKISSESNGYLINNSNEEIHRNQENIQSIDDELNQNIGNNFTKKISTLSSSPSTTTTSSSGSSSSRLTTNKANNILKTTNIESNQWPKVGILLFNSCGQCGYQYLPTIINKKLLSLMSSTTVCNKNSGNNSKTNDRFETIICEMIFGSVALNFCAKNSSKMHKLSDDLLMTSFIFQIDFSNGKTFKRKYGLAVIWDTNQCNGQLRQLILKESVIIDSLMTELKNDLINSRLKTPNDIHISVTKFMKTINDYLSVCRLTTNISEDQFIDELSTLINNYDTKATHFFVSTLLTSILMFKYKSKKMKLILWSNDVNQISFISQLLVVINQFLTNRVKTYNYIIPQLKSIKFCRSLSSIKRKSSVTPITKSIVSERKSRDESLGYESLTESSGSTTTSTICEYSNGFEGKSFRTSTPLEQSIEGMSSEAKDNFNDEENQTQTSSQLNKSRNYFREYRNLRFTSNSTTDDCINEDIDYMTPQPINIGDNNLESQDLGLNQDKFNSDISNDDIGSVTTADVEEVCESQLISGFGECSMPELMCDSNETLNPISLSQSPAISDSYLSQISMQGIINSKTVNSYEQLLSDCLKRSENSSEDTTIICDCDLWRINCVESSRCLPAIMSSSVGNLCEIITQFYALKMNTTFILKYIDNKLNELTLKSSVLKSLMENSCCDINSKLNAIKLFDRDSSQPLLSLIADNYLSEFSSIDCSNLGFDVSDIPIIIALNRHSLINSFNNNSKYSERCVNRFVETIL